MTRTSPETIKDFNEDYNRYYQRCVRFAKSYTCDLPQAECMASEALSILWEKMTAKEQVEFPLPFLFSIIRNKALHYLRHKYIKNQTHANIQSDSMREIEFRIHTLEACDPHSLYAEDVQAILHKSLDSLGEQTSRIFLLSRFQGKSNFQIAQELGVGSKTIEYHITKAIKRLKIDLKDYLPLISILIGL